jgi:carbohydrate-selective porin OprB
MKLKQLMLAPVALGMVAPVAANAADLNMAAVNQYSSEQVTSINQLSDVRPTDWAYQALSNLVDRYGCVAGYPNGTFGGGRSMTRYEAAALLNACLDRVTEQTDELKRLADEFRNELTVIQGKVSSLEAQVGELEATQFSTTTKLRGETRWVLGGLSYGGDRKDKYNDLREAVSFNYDVKLNLDTSFTGKDLLRTQLRAGNFDDSGFGAAPTPLTKLDAGFQENLGGADGGDVVAINRLYYKFPVNDSVTIAAGPRIRQDDILPVWPSVYTADKILNIFQFNGAPGTYTKVLGGGFGASVKKGGWTLGGSYVAADADMGNSAEGGVFNGNSAASTTAQLAYTGNNWNLTGAYTYSTNGVSIQGTPTLTSALPNAVTGGNTNAFSIAGYWQPSTTGWVPSISAGWGYNNSSYEQGGDTASQSWYTGLVWNDLFAKGNALGFAVGQPTFVTEQNGQNGNDGNYAFEGYYKVQVTDNIAVTPSVFYLSNPAGQGGLDTFGALVQTTFKF